MLEKVIKSSTIICVDDEISLLKPLQASLRNHFGSKFVIEVCDHPSEALELIRELIEEGEIIPVVISDYIMPVLKGDEFLREVHKLLPETRNILLSGQADMQAVQSSIKETNLTAFVMKPWDGKDLFLAVEMAVEAYYKDVKVRELNTKLLKKHDTIKELYMNLYRKGKEIVEYNNKLTKVHKKLVKSKEKQDGDYYLTSLLTKPLMSTVDRYGALSIEEFLEQKKKYNFRSKKGEIGGDFNFCDKIKINGEEYLLVINADAMGKSIQGAAGSLILGVLLNALVYNSWRARENQFQDVEDWIKQAYELLQFNFTLFDGSMFISMVLSVFDEETGKMHFVNFEHPLSVLIRNNNIRFLQEETNCYKLGVSFNPHKEELPVQSFQLEDGDVIVFGSDGRDDIVCNEKGMNEDPRQFLEILKKDSSRLETIRSNLDECGKLTDDLSLIKVNYNIK